jgi:hypothetical protein
MEHEAPDGGDAAAHMAPAEPHAGGLPSLPSGVTALGSQVLSAVMIRTGNKKALEKIQKLPAWLGNKIGDGINAVFGTKPDDAQQAKGDSDTVELTQAQAAEIEQLIAANPVEAAQLFGMLLTDAMPGALGAAGLRRRNLERYAQILNMIGAIAKELQTSLALRGFVHRDDCVSYWHFVAASNKDGCWSIDKDGERLGLNYGLELYLIELDPTDETLQGLNEAIRRDPKRHVDALTDHYGDGRTAKLKDVRELSVTFDQLAGEPASAFFGKPVPRGFESEIPYGAPALAALLASLLPALEAQSMHERALGTTLAQAEAIRTKVKGWLEA